MVNTMPATPAQKRFDELYITSSEICKELNVNRCTLLQARQRGLLPDPIAVNDAQIYVWERATVRPFVDSWYQSLIAHRNRT